MYTAEFLGTGRRLYAEICGNRWIDYVGDLNGY